MSQNYFCIFCFDKYFFKSDLRKHILNKHKNCDEFDFNFNESIESLINYCSQLVKTIKLKPRKRLPINNVKDLLIGCPLCQQIIDNYELKVFDKKEKLSKNLCFCGLSDRNLNNSLNPINCNLCQHFFHYECAEGKEYSGIYLNIYFIL